MERAIDECHLHAVHWIASEDTVLHGVLEAFLYRWDELLRNVTTLNLVNELQTAFLEVFVNRTNVNDDVGKLTASTRLLFVNLAEVNSLGDCFLVVNLWLTLVTLNLELTLQTVDDDIEVKLTHTRDDSLTTLLVSTNGECWVFLSEFSETVVKFGNVSLALWFYCYRDHSVRECH